MSVALKYSSVFSGIEAASVAWKPLGWKPVAYAEVEKFPCAVLAHHYPAVSNWGDVNEFQKWPNESIDVLVGGSPCQAFSVAGLRKGLDDPRGNLTLTYLGIVARYHPRWVLWENVPGVLSMDEGRVFGAFLGGLAESGYGFAWRVLDAQFGGVPQRRRRVWVVGCLGDWRSAAAVLFDAASLRGDSPPRRETGKEITPTLKSGPNTDRGHGARSGHDGLIVPTILSRNKGDNFPMIRHGMAVRHITPTECERLMGFPDGYTRIPYRGKPAGRCPDGPRYKALGNSMVVNEIHWIGRRITLLEELKSNGEI